MQVLGIGQFEIDLLMFQSEWYYIMLLFLSFSSFLFRSVFDLPTELVVRNGRKADYS